MDKTTDNSSLPKLVLVDHDGGERGLEVNQDLLDATPATPKAPKNDSYQKGKKFIQRALNFLPKPDGGEVSVDEGTLRDFRWFDKLKPYFDFVGKDDKEKVTMTCKLEVEDKQTKSHSSTISCKGSDSFVRHLNVRQLIKFNFHII